MPVAAIPDVADLYMDWSLGALGIDPITPLLLQWLQRWLIQIEAARNLDRDWSDRSAFGGDLRVVNLRDLENSLRIGFLFFWFFVDLSTAVNPLCARKLAGS